MNILYIACSGYELIWTSILYGLILKCSTLVCCGYASLISHRAAILLEYGIKTMVGKAFHINELEW